MEIKSNIAFQADGKTGAVAGEKPLVAEERSSKLNPHMTPSLGIEPGPYWLGTRDLTTAPALLILPTMN